MGSPNTGSAWTLERLYAIMKFKTYPLPVFEETVANLHGSRYFSVLDCFSCYWQVKLAEEDKQKTAFSTPPGPLQKCTVVSLIIMDIFLQLCDSTSYRCRIRDSPN
jgi:hypothetical protein